MNNQEAFLHFIKNAIAEDVGNGDHTSLSTIPENGKAKAIIIAKVAGMIAGVKRAKDIFFYHDSSLLIQLFVCDGDFVKPNDVLISISGNARSILQMERIALNCMQRMSGIANYTHKLCEKIKHTSTQILDTRKTTPGIRFLEKEAVVVGGGKNHRMGLYDRIMIKDNHIDFSGGITNAISRANEYLKEKKLNLPIEIEVRNFKELEEVLVIGNIHRIMLDNFSVNDLKKALQIIGKRYETEASGGITEQTITQYAETGVDYISVGALTHSVKSFDISLIAEKK